MGGCRSHTVHCLPSSTRLGLLLRTWHPPPSQWDARMHHPCRRGSTPDHDHAVLSFKPRLLDLDLPITTTIFTESRHNPVEAPHPHVARPCLAGLIAFSRFPSTLHQLQALIQLFAVVQTGCGYRRHEAKLLTLYPLAWTVSSLEQRFSLSVCVSPPLPSPPRLPPCLIFGDGVRDGRGAAHELLSVAQGWICAVTVPRCIIILFLAFTPLRDLLLLLLSRPRAKFCPNNHTPAPSPPLGTAATLAMVAPPTFHS